MFEEFAKIKAFFHERHDSFRLIDSHFDDCVDKDSLDEKAKNGRDKLFSLLRKYSGLASIEVFIRGDKTYIFDSGSTYLFMNNYKSEGWNITPIFYDTRSESPREDMEYLASAIDEMRTSNHFLIFPLITEEDWETRSFEAWQKKSRELR
jgi:hypothetical protein